MRTPTRSLVFVLSAAGVLGLLAGCDNLESESVKADRQVQAGIERHASQTGGADFTLLEQAAGNTAAGAVAQAHAKSALAQAQLAAASQHLAEVDQGRVEITRISLDLRQLLNELAAADSAVKAFERLNPQPARDELTKRLSNVQGGAEANAWSAPGNVSIPTLNALKQNIARLEGEIARRREQIKNLQADRSKAMDESERLAGESQTLKAQESVDAYKKSADLRKKAADLAIEIDKTTAAIVPFQQDLAVAQGQQKAVNEAIEQIGRQQKQMEQGWTQLQQQLQNQQALIQSIYQGGDKAGPRTAIVAKAKQLGERVAAVDTARTAAADLLQKAIANLDSAAKAASDVQRDMQSRIDAARQSQAPEQAAWKILKEVVHPADYKLRQAVAQHTLANLHLGHSQMLALRGELIQAAERILKAANLAVPAELAAGSLDADVKTAREQAKVLFDDAAKTATDVAEGSLSTPDRKNTAKATLALVVYGQSQLATASGQAGEAAELQRLAKQHLESIEAGKVTMPLGLPAAIAPATPVAPATAPAGA